LAGDVTVKIVVPFIPNLLVEKFQRLVFGLDGAEVAGRSFLVFPDFIGKQGVESDALCALVGLCMSG
jgi:hypothetical protein